MLCFPNCKINLGLYVTRRRDDGYHDIETVFYPVGFKDVLEVVPAEFTSLRVSGIQPGGSERDNLAWKAYELMRQAYPGKIPAVAMYLHKAIPMGAGLGGGSADGAFMLRLLNDYCNLALDKPALAALALQLGSDCPFFIYNTPQLATGRGEKMAPVSLNLSSYSLQIICPELHVSTADAFSSISSKPAGFNLQNLANLPVEEWKDTIHNDFETTVFAKHPGLKIIKEQLYAQGAIYASMSGSGSAIYGIFPKGERAKVDAGVKCKVIYEE